MQIHKTEVEEHLLQFRNRMADAALALDSISRSLMEIYETMEAEKAARL
jgi:hypothetical protein